ncbi:hypothetical protein BsIDN1_23920 [Bacillus safensis]|uniref:Uncharacterized protein n=1 Tax=Bacillus safensis TaxID=561879 RepID=A0A5S9M9D8_BACIA|nr:hypothetical protein BsIDN1_23920 [Bacillus safensis]
MDAAIILEYGWVLLVLIGLEGILAADNALVMAVMVKHLPEKQKKKRHCFTDLQVRLSCGLVLCFLFFFLVDVWQVQAIGAIYLLYISIHHVFKIARI